MKSHRIWEWTFEEIIVFCCQLFDNNGQTLFLWLINFIHAFEFIPWYNHRFKWPCCPIRHNYQPILVFNHDTLTTCYFLLHIVIEHCTAIFFIVLFQMDLFNCRFIWQKWTSPYLTMWMRIRATHCSAFILEYLDPFIFWTQFSKLSHPPDNKQTCYVNKRRK